MNVRQMQHQSGRQSCYRNVCGSAGLAVVYSFSRKVTAEHVVHSFSREVTAGQHLTTEPETCIHVRYHCDSTEMIETLQ